MGYTRTEPHSKSRHQQEPAKERRYSLSRSIVSASRKGMVYQATPNRSQTLTTKVLVVVVTQNAFNEVGVRSIYF